MNCTCGSEAVGSKIHSQWCDIFGQFRIKYYEYVKEDLIDYSNYRILYMTTMARDPEKYFRLARDYFNSRTQIYSVHINDSHSIVFPKKSQLIFDVASEESLVLHKPDHVLIQSYDGVQEYLTDIVYPSVKGYCKIVDAWSDEILN